MAYYRDVKLLTKLLLDYEAECRELARDNADQPLLKEYYRGKQEAYERVLNELDTLAPGADENAIYESVWKKHMKEDLRNYIDCYVHDNPDNYDLDRLIYLIFSYEDLDFYDVPQITLMQRAIEDYNNGGGVC